MDQKSITETPELPEEPCLRVSLRGPQAPCCGMLRGMLRGTLRKAHPPDGMADRAEAQRKR